MAHNAQSPPRPGSKKARLLALYAAGALDGLTLEEMGRLVGASRETARQVLPQGVGVGQGREARLVAPYLGKMTDTEAAKAAGVSVECARKARLRAGLGLGPYVYPRRSLDAVLEVAKDLGEFTLAELQEALGAPVRGPSFARWVAEGHFEAVGRRAWARGKGCPYVYVPKERPPVPRGMVVPAEAVLDAPAGMSDYLLTARLAANGPVRYTGVVKTRRKAGIAPRGRSRHTTPQPTTQDTKP